MKLATRLFTDAQLRALEWLPSDGAFRGLPGPYAALDSLINIHPVGAPRLAERIPQYGGRKPKFRLTEVGISVKESMKQ